MTNINYPVLTSSYNKLHMNILENGLLTSDCTWHFHDIISPFNRMYFILDGDGYLTQNGITIPLLKNHVYLIPAGSCYDYGCNTLIKKFYLHFELQFLPGIDLFEGIQTCLSLPFNMDDLTFILNYRSNPHLSHIFLLKSIFDTYLSRFLTVAYPNEDYKAYFKGYEKQYSVLSYIQNNLRSSLTISEICDALGYAYHTLNRNFQTDTGMSLKKYKERMLLQKAKSLLLCSQLSIAEIADSLDFCDAYYFSRFFKQCEGIPPAQYRKSHTS